jgi:hypothetical protein
MSDVSDGCGAQTQCENVHQDFSIPIPLWNVTSHARQIRYIVVLNIHLHNLCPSLVLSKNPEVTIDN